MLTCGCGAMQVTPAAEEHTATMIFLHGFGSQGPGRGKLVAESLNIPWCKIVCPLAPHRVGALGQGLQSWSSVDLLLEQVGAPVVRLSSALMALELGRVLACVIALLAHLSPSPSHAPPPRFFPSLALSFFLVLSVCVVSLSRSLCLCCFKHIHANTHA
jgi:hypothetical protein